VRVVFFGTPEPAALALEALLQSPHEVAAVVTQPDRPRGRGRAVEPSPVKRAAQAAGLPVLQPETPKEEGFARSLREHRPEALAVVAYGHILPVAVLEVAPALNVHFSSLPRYRGAAPVQRALMDGVGETGVSVFLLEPTLDTGPVVLSEKVAVGDEETAGELLGRLAPIGARLLISSLNLLATASVKPQPQDDAEASPAPKIKPEEARIDWSLPADRIANVVRGLNPSPGAWTSFRGKRLSVWRARASDGDASPPGVIMPRDRDRLVIAAGRGSVELIEVQPEGKRRMTAAEFARGYRPKQDEVLGAGTPETSG
jgi:methionyl-tRNA formyltransferase